jgi:hypothetical protein
MRAPSWPASTAWHEKGTTVRGFIVRSAARYTKQWRDAFMRYGLMDDSSGPGCESPDKYSQV